MLLSLSWTSKVQAVDLKPTWIAHTATIGKVPGAQPRITPEEALKACDEALNACGKALESKDAVIREQDNIIKLQDAEIIKFREEQANPGILKSPILWLAIGLTVGVIIAK